MTVLSLPQKDRDEVMASLEEKLEALGVPPVVNPMTDEEWKQELVSRIKSVADGSGELIAADVANANARAMIDNYSKT